MAKSVRKKPFEPLSRAISVDGWTLKCLYNTSDYVNRIASGEFVKLYEELGKPKPDGERTVVGYYGRQDDRLARVRLQWFERGGLITRSGKPEPKWMYQDGFAYHLHGGDRWWEELRRDLTNFRYNDQDVRIIAAKKKYAAWRAFKCARLGPIEAIWRRWWFSSRPYAAYVGAVETLAKRWRIVWKAMKPFRSGLKRLLSGPRGHVLALS